MLLCMVSICMADGTAITQDNIQRAVNGYPGNSATYGDISLWNVSTVVNMANLFDQKGGFNRDISFWDTGEVTCLNLLVLLLLVS